MMMEPGKKIECSGVAGLRCAEPTIGERGRVLYLDVLAL